MTYKFSFNALNSKGEFVGSRRFTIETTHPLDLEKDMSLERMCVEYARLTGLKCSFAFIIDIIRKGDQNDD